MPGDQLNAEKANSNDLGRWVKGSLDAVTELRGCNQNMRLKWPKSHDSRRRRVSIFAAAVCAWPGIWINDKLPAAR